MSKNSTPATSSPITTDGKKKNTDNANVPAIMDDLVLINRGRKFAMTAQQRIDRATESFISSYCFNYSSDLEPAKRKDIFKQAMKARKDIEAVDRKLPTDDRMDLAMKTIEPKFHPVVGLVFNAQAARENFDVMRDKDESKMKKLVQQLPVHSMVLDISGFGELGLAVILGETGNLSNYATKERVWKRVGLAVEGDGMRQRRHTDKELAIQSGYNPRRHASIWAVSDSMFRHQWRGEKEGVPAHAIGKYGEIYGARKKATEGKIGADGKPWTDAHRDADARRIMVKALVADLVSEWHTKIGVSEKAATFDKPCLQKAA